MKHKFRQELFDKIRSELMGVNGKQRDVAQSLGMTQKDVSVIKLGRIETFSTDKLLDMAGKCGWSFEFKVVEGDKALMAGAVAKGKTDMQKDLGRLKMDFDEMGVE